MKDYSPREAYEEDVRRRPTYDSGKPRKQWDQLPEHVQWSWRRTPTPRDWIGERV